MRLLVWGWHRSRGFWAGSAPGPVRIAPEV